MTSSTANSENETEALPRSHIKSAPNNLETVIIHFERIQKNPTREQRENILEIIRSINPNTLKYLDDNKVEYIPLASTGSLVANVNQEILELLKQFNYEIRIITPALNSYKVYKKVLDHK